MPEKVPQILIIDDEASICELLRQALTGKNYACECVSSAKAALEMLTRQVFDLALIDIRLPDSSGLELLKQMRVLYPAVSGIMLTAIDDLATAVESVKAGAQDYITKPFDLERVYKAIQTVLTDKQTAEISANTKPTFKEIDAIALGVEARQDMLDIHSEKVIQQTIAVARQMGFPEDKIQQWVAARSAEKTQKIKQVTDSLFKLS